MAGQRARRRQAVPTTHRSPRSTRSANDFWSALTILPRSPGRGGAPTAAATRKTNCAGGCRNADLMINRESGIVMARAATPARSSGASCRRAARGAPAGDDRGHDRRGHARRRLPPGHRLDEAGRAGLERTPAPGGGDAHARPADAELPVGELRHPSGAARDLRHREGSLSPPVGAQQPDRDAQVVEEVVALPRRQHHHRYDDRKQARISATTTPQSVSVGMVMSVTPQISADGDITLNVRPTISHLRLQGRPQAPRSATSPTKAADPHTRSESMLRLRSGSPILGGG